MRKSLFALLAVSFFTASLLLADSKQNNPPHYSQEAVVLRGIALVSDTCTPAGFSEGIHTFGLPTEKDLNCSLETYLNQPLSDQLLQNIQATIVCYYQNRGCPFMHVCLPEQEITNGYLTVVISPARVGDITWTGCQHCTTRDLSQHFVLQSNDLISQQILLNDLTWMNRNPFHHTEAILQPGREEGTVDIELRTQDRRMFRLYAGADNTGNDFTDYGRIYAGINWGDALWRGDIFTYQYSFAPDFNRFQAHFGQYLAFLPWRDILTIYGGYASSHPEMEEEFQNFDHVGRSGQASLRYTIPLKEVCMPFKEELTLGIDWKYTNTNVFFVDFPEPISTQSVNLLEFMASYGYTYEKECCDCTLSVDGHFSPGHWLPHQNIQDYNDLRDGAKVIYFYADALMGLDYTFNTGASLGSLLRGQISTCELLPMQMFSIGGFNTVRGYFEHDYLADDALCYNLELRAPPVTYVNCCRHEFTFLLFFDAGYGHDIHRLDDQRINEYLIGVGPGFRYNINSNLAARVDYGFQLHHLKNSDDHIGLVHIGAQFSF